MVYVAIYTGLRVSELAGLRWNDIHENSITVDERYCRGDWGAPKSEASNATIGVNRCVIERSHRLKLLTVKVRAGRAVRTYKVVKSDGPENLVFQSVQDGKNQSVTITSSTTLDIYQQFVPESQMRVVERLSNLSQMVN